MRFLLVTMCALVLSACSTSPKKSDSVAGSLKSVELKKPVELKLKADPERKELVMFLSRTRSENLQNGQTVQDTTEETKFATETDSATTPQGLISYRIATVDKDGKLDLSQLAMPEFGRILGLVLYPNGKVASASGQPKNSIFYVSPVSLPTGPVQIGDTWATSESWISQSDKTPMMMETVSILKNVFECGNDQCADIEMSGDVDVQGGLQNVSFKSHWVGRMLFAINAGVIVWSRTDSLETLQAETAGTRVRSCLESVMMKPDSLRLANFSAGPKCDPAQAPAQTQP